MIAWLIDWLIDCWLFENTIHYLRIATQDCSWYKSMIVNQFVFWFVLCFVLIWIYCLLFGFFGFICLNFFVNEVRYAQVLHKFDSCPELNHRTKNSSWFFLFFLSYCSSHGSMFSSSFSSFSFSSFSSSYSSSSSFFVFSSSFTSTSFYFYFFLVFFILFLFSFFLSFPFSFIIFPFLLFNAYLPV